MLTVEEISLYEMEGSLEEVINKLLAIKELAYERGLADLQIDVEEDLNGTQIPYLIIRGVK